MELALYDPDGGYYRAADARPGRGGDFLTAPELHPIFGETLAPCASSESGSASAGRTRSSSGSTAPVRAPSRPHPARLAASRPRAGDPLRSPSRSTTRRDRRASRPARPTPGWPTALEPAADGAVRRGRARQRGPRRAARPPRPPARATSLRELAVGLVAGRRVRRGRGRAHDARPGRAPGRRGHRPRRRPDGRDLPRARRLDRRTPPRPCAAGVAPAHRLRRTRPRSCTTRSGGATARCAPMSVTRSSDDPYRHVGRQDLTAHVDVTAVERAAQAAGLTTVGITTQAEALMGLGIEDRLRADPGRPGDHVRGLRARCGRRCMRLLDPAAMGRFRVMAFGRDWPADGEPLGPVRVTGCRATPGLTDGLRLGRMPYCRARPRGRHADRGRRTTAPPGGRDVNLHARSARRAPRSVLRCPPGPPAACRPSGSASSSAGPARPTARVGGLSGGSRRPDPLAVRDRARARMSVRGRSAEHAPARRLRAGPEGSSDWNSSGTSWASPSPACRSSS